MRGQACRKALRAIREEVDRWLDRRGRTDPALVKRAVWRRRLRRDRLLGRSLDKLQSPNREKAWVFRDDQLLPAPSNAVERGHRRHRKLQKTV